jgi:hypothetical protein
MLKFSMPLCQSFAGLHVQLKQGRVEFGSDGVVTVRGSDALRDCIDRNLAFKPKHVAEIIVELSERLAVESWMRSACSSLQDQQVNLALLQAVSPLVRFCLCYTYHHVRFFLVYWDALWFEQQKFESHAIQNGYFMCIQPMALHPFTTG